MKRKTKMLIKINIPFSNHIFWPKSVLCYSPTLYTHYSGVLVHMFPLWTAFWHLKKITSQKNRFCMVWREWQFTSVVCVLQWAWTDQCGFHCHPANTFSPANIRSPGRTYQHIHSHAHDQHLASTQWRVTARSKAQKLSSLKPQLRWLQRGSFPHDSQCLFMPVKLCHMSDSDCSHSFLF